MKQIIATLQLIICFSTLVINLENMKPSVQPNEAQITQIIIEPETEIPPETESETIYVPSPVVKRYYDVPLDHEVQDYIFEICEKYDVQQAIIIAMIERESDFRTKVIGDSGGSYGLMQIQEKWHKQRMKELRVTDLLDPCQNVLVGVDLYAELYHMNGDVAWALMAYNGGIAYANRKTNANEISTYALEIMERADELDKNFFENKEEQ